MSLQLADNTAENINHGNNPANVDPATVLMWGNLADVNNNLRFLFSKNAGGVVNSRILCFRTGADGTVFRFQFNRVTTAASEDSNSVLTTGWNFIGVTWDTAGGSAPVIYWGNLSTVVTDQSAGGGVAGSGAHGDDSGGPWRVGDATGAGALASGADWGVFMVFNAALSLGQIREQQFRPHVISSTQIFTHYGFNGTGSQPDWSGNSNAGTVNGAGITVENHVPLGPPMGFDRSPNQPASVLRIPRYGYTNFQVPGVV